MNGFLVLGGIFTAVLGIAFLINYLFHRHRRHQWTGLAEALSLDFETKALVYQKIFGSIRDRPIVVRTSVMYVGISAVLGIQIQLFTRDLHGLKLYAKRRSFAERMAKKLQSKADMSLGGDNRLLQQYSIKARPLRLATALFGSDSPLTQLLLQRKAHILRIKDDSVYFVMPGVNHSKDEMLAVIRLLIDGVEFCEQLVENELPLRLLHKDAPASMAQFLAMAQGRSEHEFSKSRPHGLIIAVLIGVTCLLPALCLFLMTLLNMGIQLSP